MRCVGSELAAIVPLGGLARASAVALTIALVGCASDDAARQTAQQVRPQSVQTAHAPEVEDDGLPPQAPPRRDAVREPDDPSEPYSPNYGSAPAPRRVGATASPPPTPHDKVALSTPPPPIAISIRIAAE